MSHLLIVDAADEPGWFLCKPHGNGEWTSNYAPILREINLPIAKICCEMSNVDSTQTGVRCQVGRQIRSRSSTCLIRDLTVERRLKNMWCVSVVHKSVCPLVSDQDSMVLIERWRVTPRLES